MASIPNYISVEEKRNVFPRGYYQINTSSEFDEWYNAWCFKKNFIYRGVNDACFKNYTSAQREALLLEIKDPKKLVHDEIINLLHCNNNLLNKYCKSLGVTCSSIYLMSYVQHYGGVSPLLDFSYNFNKALFFMIDKEVPTVAPEKESRCLNNYMSLYSLLYDETLEQKLLELTKKYKKTNFNDDTYRTTASTILEKTVISSKFLNNLDPEAFANGAIWSLNRPYKMNQIELQKKRDFYLYSNSLDEARQFAMSEMQPILINNDIKSFNLFGEKGTWGTLISNLNITAQDGCFIYFDKEFYPLEAPLICVDIHRTLTPYIKKRYLKKYTKKNLFPNPKKMVQESLSYAINNI